MKVLKFGGTSLGNIADLPVGRQVEKVLSIVAPQKSQVAAVVISAFAGVTNNLSDLYQKAIEGEDWRGIFKKISSRHTVQITSLIKSKKLQTETTRELKSLLSELALCIEDVYKNRNHRDKARDEILSFGERLSASTINAVFADRGIEAQYVDAREIIVASRDTGRVLVDIKNSNVLIRAAILKNSKILKVVTGFIARDAGGATTTLGRGGSDYTAGLIGSAIDASSIEIWTDVDGVMSADPRLVPTAFSIPEMSYKEALEMSHFGAKVLYSETIIPVMRKKISLIIKNTNNSKHPGTTITSKSSNKNLMKVISSVHHVTLLRLLGPDMSLVASPASRAFGALEKAGVPILLTTQASGENTLCFVINREFTAIAEKSLNDEFKYEIGQALVNKIHTESDYGLIAVVGDGMRSIPGVAGRFFSVLGRNSINIAAIAQGSSERVISAVVTERDLEKAVMCVHGAFFYSENIVHIYLIGSGLIGTTLLNQINQKKTSLSADLKLNLKVVGIANSTKMIIDHKGINTNDWKTDLKRRGTKSNLSKFIESMIDLDLPHSIFVDCTASADIGPYYPQILNKNISIVTPNKKANTQDYPKYKILKEASYASKGKYLYETTVGAGLPTISTLRDLQATGDQIYSIAGIFSGSLSYIFNNFSSKVPFSTVVIDAQKKGYTEPDPRDDLNGMDVARKLLILSRDLGLKLNLSDINVENLIPEDARGATTVDEFFVRLKAHDAEFEALAQKAANKGMRLRYVATIDVSSKKPKADVRLIEVSPDNPFYTLKGADNIFAFTTQRYSELPLVIKGPGAGADVTAGGVFADILRIADYFAT